MSIRLEDQDVWDDSALMNSWNEALVEYTKYHSIQATGKSMEDVLSAEELKDLKRDYGELVDDVEAGAAEASFNPDLVQQGHAVLEEVYQGRKSATQDGMQVEEPVSLEQPQTQDARKELRALNISRESRNAEITAVPQAMLGSVQDDALKNVMMSWYYAGYYTGLYEGQQRTTGTPQNDQPS